MHIRGVVALAVSVAIIGSGCGPQRSAPETTADSSATTTASSTASTVAAPAAPACGTVEIPFDPPLSEQHVRCTLRIDEHLSLAVSSDPAWSFTLKSDGTATQEFQELTDKIGETGVAPMLADIDHSGKPVLLVVTGVGGTGGEPMAVWRLTADEKFVRAGELFGFRTFYRTPEGFFGNYAHSSASSGGVTLYRWDGDTLAEVVNLDVQVAGSPSYPSETREWIHNGNVECTLNDSDYPPGAAAKRDEAMKAAGVDPATAAQHFCNQDWVSTLYK